MPGCMELGGVERSLLGLLNSLDYDQWDVDLFLYGHNGPLFEHIDPRVNLLPEVKELAYLRASFGEKLRHKCIYSAWLRLKDALLSPFRPIDFDRTWAQVMRKCVTPLDKEYDLALSFFLPFDLMAERVKADRKIGWIHTDYSVEKYNHDKLLEQYQKCDRIAAVSEACANTFTTCFPSLAGKVMTVENSLPTGLIRAQAKENITDMPKKGVSLLSVGRYCTAKNFDNVPDICARLLKMGHDVTWYIIGFGPDEELIKQKISEAGMEDRVILLGKKDNPYPYMAACDVYVQPSRYEGKAVTVCEAQLLGKPVVIARYPTSATQLEDGVDGVIVPQDNEGCARGIADLLADPAKMRQLSKTCCERDYSNAKEAQKLYTLR